jgi:hypothetical protein
MSNEKETKVEIIWRRLKNNKGLAIIIVTGAIIISLATFTDSITKLVHDISKLFPDSQKTIIHQLDKSLQGKSNMNVAENETNDILNISNDNIIVDFTTDNEKGNLKYILKNRKKLIEISPYNSYLKLLKEGGPINSSSIYGSPFDLQIPILDFKITNNSEKVISFTHAVFNISSSKLNPFPIICMLHGYNMGFTITNLGWDSVYNGRINFNLVPITTEANYEERLKNELILRNFKDSYNIDLTSIFNDLGVDTGFIKSDNRRSIMSSNSDTYEFSDNQTHKITTIKKIEYEKQISAARGKFKDGSARIYGVMLYEGINSEGTRSKDTLKFDCIVNLAGPLPGAPFPPGCAYDVNLETNKDKYIKEFPIAQAIKPKDVDRFNIKIFASKSSIHFFDLTLFYNDNKQIVFPPIRLNYFRSNPR